MPDSPLHTSSLYIRALFRDKAVDSVPILPQGAGGANSRLPCVSLVAVSEHREECQSEVLTLAYSESPSRQEGMAAGTGCVCVCVCGGQGLLSHISENQEAEDVLLAFSFFFLSFYSDLKL